MFETADRYNHAFLALRAEFEEYTAKGKFCDLNLESVLSELVQRDFFTIGISKV